VFDKKDPLPDPSESVKVPDHMRLPFKGKLAPPTSILDPDQRRAAFGGTRRRSRLSGFLKGLVAGPLLVVALDLGGEQVVRHLPDTVRFDPPIPLRALVFVAMAAGVLLVALLVSLVLGLQAAGWVLGKGRPGLLGALARGVGRLLSAAAALGLTLGALGGTAWFMIPREDWGRTRAYLEQKGQEGLRKARDLVQPPAK
jgi:hypothetical protein